MITATAMLVLYYTATVTAGALLVRVFCPRRFAARRAALRVAALFGVFALSAAYVCLDLGPQIDARLIGAERPLMLTGDPAPIDI